MKPEHTPCKPCDGEGKRLWFDWSGGSDWRVCDYCDGTGAEKP